MTQNILMQMVAIMLIGISFFGCPRLLDNVDNRMIIRNNSDAAILFEFSFDYPDTTLGELLVNPSLNPQIYRVESKMEERYGHGRNWEISFENYIHSDTLIIFIFSADTLQNYDWDQIKRDSKILERYDLSLQDLLDRNWVVEYPK